MAETVADLLERLGGISPQRVRCNPPIGTATEQDVIDIECRENRIFELVDGVLVEKAMGYPQSVLTCAIGAALRSVVVPRNLGVVTGPDGLVELIPALVRAPDVAFTSWDRIPGRCVPADAIPRLVPDLAIEVLSRGNTPGEMRRKIGEYFSAGVRLVWLVHPNDRSITVYTSPDHATVFQESDTLDASDVLPGFSIELSALFAELDRRADRFGKDA
jgi:Uma2 family endonuclease